MSASIRAAYSGLGLIALSCASYDARSLTEAGASGSAAEQSSSLPSHPGGSSGAGGTGDVPSELAGSAGALNTPAPSADEKGAPWTQEHPFRRCITIVGAASNQSEFPLLVRATPQLLEGAQDGAFTFTDVDGVVLAIDVERWDAVVGLLVWVRVPQLSAGAKLFLYYGGRGAARKVSAETWSRYASVWHLGDAIEARSGLAGEITGVEFEPGPLGQAATLSVPLRGHIALPVASVSLASVRQVTVSAWIRARTFAPSDDKFSSLNILSLGRDAREDPNLNHSALAWQLTVQSGEPSLYARFDDGTTVQSPGSVALDTWQHLATDADLGTGVTRFFLNGTALGGPVQHVFESAQFGDDYSLQVASVGASPGGQYAYFPGSIDELRFSHTLLGPEWLRDEYASQHDPDSFVTWSQRQERSTTLPAP